MSFPKECYPSDPPLIVGVNPSARQLQYPDLVGDVEGVLREAGLDPKWLTLEITESVVVRDGEHHIDALRKPGNLGVRFAIRPSSVADGSSCAASTASSSAMRSERPDNNAHTHSTFIDAFFREQNALTRLRDRLGPLDSRELSSLSRIQELSRSPTRDITISTPGEIPNRSSVIPVLAGATLK